MISRYHDIRRRSVTKRLLVSMDDERYEDLRRLAFEKKAPMADLVRHAVEELFEDDLDGMRLRRRLEEHAADPSGSMTLDEYMESQGIDVSAYRSPKRTTRSRRAAG
jgi:hypothetical protein